MFLLPRPNHTGILTECNVTTKVSKALNLEWDYDSLKHTSYQVSKTDSNGLAILIYLILDGYTYHITIAHILQGVL